MSRNRIIAILLGITLALFLFAVFRSCRSGSVPPAEREAVDETSYRASLDGFFDDPAERVLRQDRPAAFRSAAFRPRG